VADAVAGMNLRHVVITSVARDELTDGGAGVWAATIRAVRHRNPATAIEVLVPDFKAASRMSTPCSMRDPTSSITTSKRWNGFRSRCACRPAMTGSRTVLRHATARGFTTKTGIMLGLGERQEEIEQTLRDVVSDGVQILTIGQYLQPTAQNTCRLKRWVTPEEFHRWKQFGLSIGLGVVESGPLVRSSYHADEQSQKYTGADHLNRRTALGGSC